MIIEWSDSVSVHVTILDKQHKMMFETINHLQEAISQGKDQKVLREIFSDLKKYTEVHFDTEERYFDDFRFDGADEHKEAHKVFRNKMFTLWEKYSVKNEKISDELIIFLVNWWKAHVVILDQKYVSCFNAHGLV